MLHIARRLVVWFWIAARTAIQKAGIGLFLLSGLSLLALYAWAIWKAPTFLVNQDLLSRTLPEHRLTAEHNARLIVISVGGAVVVLAGLLYTARNYRLAHRGQVTERFTKALERLGSDELYVRIGGILALEHVMRDSPKHHNDVVQVLVSFIRDQAPRAAKKDAPSTENWIHPPIGTETVDLPPEPAADLHAALKTIGRRPRRPWREKEWIDLSQLHIRGADLQHAWLRGAELAGADLEGANLQYAQLWAANLREANLGLTDLMGTQLRAADLFCAQLHSANMIHADLRHAQLLGAQLSSADRPRSADLRYVRMRGALLMGLDFWGADLRYARLKRADLRGAQLLGAKIQHAQLQGADLTDALVMPERLLEAKVDRNTILPGGFATERARSIVDRWHP